MCAVSRNQSAVASLLLENGADVNARDNYGLTPLHYVSENGCVDLLLEAGADPQARTCDGQTPEDIWDDEYEAVIADQIVYWDYDWSDGDIVDLYEMIFCGLRDDPDFDARLEILFDGEIMIQSNI